MISGAMKGIATAQRTSSISTPVYVVLEIASETSFASCVCSWMSAIVLSTTSIDLRGSHRTDPELEQVECG